MGNGTSQYHESRPQQLSRSLAVKIPIASLRNLIINYVVTSHICVMGGGVHDGYSRHMYWWSLHDGHFRHDHHLCHTRAADYDTHHDNNDDDDTNKEATPSTTKTTNATTSTLSSTTTTMRGVIEWQQSSSTLPYGKDDINRARSLWCTTCIHDGTSLMIVSADGNEKKSDDNESGSITRYLSIQQLMSSPSSSSSLSPQWSCSRWPHSLQLNRWRARSSHFVTTINGTCHLFGGGSRDGYYNDRPPPNEISHLMYDSHAQGGKGQWLVMPPLPPTIPIYDIATAYDSTNGIIYLAGGSMTTIGAINIVPSFAEYSINDKKWHHYDACPTARRQAISMYVHHTRYVYVGGGRNQFNEICMSFDRFETTDKKWHRSGCRLPQPLTMISYHIVDGAYLVLSGTGLKGHQLAEHTFVWYIKLTELEHNRWHRAPNLPVPLTDVTLCSFQY
jgi:hypothetical protein